MSLFLSNLRIRKVMVIGGIASGKSQIAERLVNGLDLTKTYIATAQALDSEMRTKIQKHQDMRGSGWTTIEAPLDIGAALPNTGVTLLDCLTMWLSNISLSGADLPDEQKKLLNAIKAYAHPLVMVTNELGQGGIAENKLMRQFQRDQGLLNQEVAKLCDLVLRVDAGIPTAIKGQLPAGLTR